MLKFEVGSPFPMPLDAKEGAVFSVYHAADLSVP